MARPRLALSVVLIASLAVRAALLGAPCHTPCRAAADRLLIFDEVYYVNAARRIAGVAVASGDHYASTPAGRDGNAEHPQLVKLLVAGAIEAIGDGPLAWRIIPLLAGTLALLGLFALVRAAGGSAELALLAIALAAADDLWLVHGRIATLDMPVAAAMVWSAALALRGRPLAAGVALGLGAATKLVALFLLPALGLAWLLTRRSGGPRALRSLAVTAATAAAVGYALLAVMDRIAPPWDPNLHRPVTGGPLGHLRYMLDFASAQVTGHGSAGIASSPFGWWVDVKPILYLNITGAHPAPGLAGVHPDVHFLALVNPALLLAGLAGLALTVWRLARRRDAPGVDRVALAWCAGTWTPFALASVLAHRTSYLYYMVVVVPGLYVAAAGLLRGVPWPRWALRGWAAMFIAGAVVLYPLTPLPG